MLNLGDMGAALAVLTAMLVVYRIAIRRGSIFGREVSGRARVEMRSFKGGNALAVFALLAIADMASASGLVASTPFTGLLVLGLAAGWSMAVAPALTQGLLGMGALIIGLLNYVVAGDVVGAVQYLVLVAALMAMFALSRGMTGK